MGQKDHPHAYGDKIKLVAGYVSYTGSSPRVWGQVVGVVVVAQRVGIIPTRMGTRYLEKSIIDFSQDHPHAYGDKRISSTS